MSKKPSFMQRFGRQHVKGSQTLLRSAQNQFLTTLPLFREGGSSKRFLLVTSEQLRQFVNTLTTDYKYSRSNWENLSHQVPMQTSLKLKTCPRFFIVFLKSTLNFEYFEKKDQSQSLSVTDIINCETCSYLNVQKAIFQATLRKTTC